MGTGTITAEQLAKTAAKATARRVTTATELGAGAAAAERFAPKVQEYFTNVVKNNDGRSTVVYMKPSEIMSEVGLKSIQGDDPLSGMQYQRMYRNKTLDKGITVDANVIDDGTLQLANADNPSLLNFLSVQGNDDAIPVVMRIGKGIPKDGTLPAYTNRGMRPIQYPHLAPTATGASRIPEAAVLVPEDIKAINNAPWLNEAIGTREYSTRADDLLARDVQSTIPGIVYVNSKRAKAFGPEVAGVMKKAEKMAAEGKTTKEIWNATKAQLRAMGDKRFSGVSTGFPDGMPRLEYITEDFAIRDSAVDVLNEGARLKTRTVLPAEDVFAPGLEPLYKAAPELKTLSVGFDPFIAKDQFGFYNRDLNSIMIGAMKRNHPESFPKGISMGATDPAARHAARKLLHEYNHAVDGVMKFARGGSWSEVAPEKFAEALELSTIATHAVTESNRELIGKIINRRLFDGVEEKLSLNGIEAEDLTGLLALVKKDGLIHIENAPAWLGDRIRRDLKRLDIDIDAEDILDEINEDLEKLTDALEDSPQLQEVFTLIEDNDYLLTLREVAMEKYENIYGEESANLAVYRTSKYKDVEALRGMEPSAQMEGRNKIRNKLKPTDPPEFYDPKRIKRIEDARFEQITKGLRNNKQEKKSNVIFGKFFREDR